MKKLSEFTFRDNGDINCSRIGCDDCPIYQFVKKKGYGGSREFVEAKGLTMKINSCVTMYHYLVKLEKLERILSL